MAATAICRRRGKGRDLGGVWYARLVTAHKTRANLRFFHRPGQGSFRNTGPGRSAAAGSRCDVSEGGDVSS
jgi:hypothetical protein